MTQLERVQIDLRHTDLYIHGQQQDKDFDIKCFPIGHKLSENRRFEVY